MSRKRLHVFPPHVIPRTHARTHAHAHPRSAWTKSCPGLLLLPKQQRGAGLGAPPALLQQPVLSGDASHLPFPTPRQIRVSSDLRNSRFDQECGFREANPARPRPPGGRALPPALGRDRLSVPPGTSRARTPGRNTPSAGSRSPRGLGRGSGLS